ncbi:MAG: amino acid ABC transporter substrate-binding protein [Desulfuromonadaceae bacterium]|nr:amino acid ABC transporter substrate-binding protein [Desulfuromonadaceae bacterium]
MKAVIVAIVRKTLRHHALSFPALGTLVTHAAILLLCCVQTLHAAPLSTDNLSKTEILRLGERMYRDGILPSGAPLPAFIKGDVEVDSRAFSCSSCHLRAGLGSFEGGVITPPTTGNKLYKPYRRPPSLGDVADQSGRYVYAKTVIERPAYTRESLATALRFGTDPAAQVFNDVMPRYPLSDSDMSILISYLEALSSEPSPGASTTEFRFATIISDDVSPADRKALLLPLQKFIAKKNQQLGMFNDFKKFGYSPTAEMKYAFRKASLDIWELKGAPATWRRQLAAYYAAKPVFALLGGITNSEWRPIHDFCEAEHLPCLFPITDFPVVSETGWYTYYFNKGYYQEGEAVARYLNRLESLPAAAPILQIVQDTPVGKALASGFDTTWKEMGRPAVASVTLTAKQLHDLATNVALLKKYSPATVLLWTDAAILPQLPKLVASLPGSGTVFVSSSALGKKTATIAENIRTRVYITYPYRLTPYVGSKIGGYDAKVPIMASATDFGDRRITSRTTAMLQQATLQGLNLIYDNLYRDHLLDVMSMQMDLTVRDYERFSFGPGQRSVSKGCYIIQLGPGSDPPLLPRSEWVVQ